MMSFAYFELVFLFLGMGLIAKTALRFGDHSVSTMYGSIGIVAIGIPLFLNILAPGKLQRFLAKPFFTSNLANTKCPMRFSFL